MPDCPPLHVPMGPGSGNSPGRTGEFHQPVQAPNRSIPTHEIADVCPLAPCLGLGRIGRMPKVIRVRPRQNGSHLHPCPPQTNSQIIVLAAPSHKVLIVAIDPLIVATPQSQAAAEKLWLCRVSNQAIPPTVDELPCQPPPFAAGDSESERDQPGCDPPSLGQRSASSR